MVRCRNWSSLPAAARAGIFYTGTIGAGAVSPFFYGLLGDAFSVTTALVVIAAVVLLTLPITLMLRPALRDVARYLTLIRTCWTTAAGNMSR